MDSCTRSKSLTWISTPWETRCWKLHGALQRASSLGKPLSFSATPRAALLPCSLLITLSVYIPLARLPAMTLNCCLGFPLSSECSKLGVGASVGIFATVFNSPFDVVKSRVQAQMPGMERKYKWTLPSLALIAREEGAMALYKVRGGEGREEVEGPEKEVSLGDEKSDWLLDHCSPLFLPPPPPFIQGFAAKALRLGLGQTVGYLVFTETLQRLNALEK
jgi:hypothetical protein